MTSLNHTNIIKQDVAKQCETIRNYIKLQKQFTFAKVQSQTICRSGVTRADLIMYRMKVFHERMKQFVVELNQRDDGGVTYSKKMGRYWYRYHKGHLIQEEVLDK